jgi:hypothetical protein
MLGVRDAVQSFQRMLETKLLRRISITDAQGVFEKTACYATEVLLISMRMNFVVRLWVTVGVELLFTLNVRTRACVTT